MATPSMKNCTKCGELKTLDQFGIRGGDRSDLRSICKKCNAHYVRSKYRENLLENRQIKRGRAKANGPNKEANAKSAKQYAANYPERKRAVRAVRTAIHAGRLTRLPCMICGDEKSNAHHSSYAPDMHLAVTWLCLEHHSEAHRKEWRGE